MSENFRRRLAEYKLGCICKSDKGSKFFKFVKVEDMINRKMNVFECDICGRIVKKEAKSLEGWM